MPQCVAPLIFLCVLFFHRSVAQSKLQFTSQKQQAKISFEWRSNQIIIPLKINDVLMNFLIDTGVGHTLIFDSHKAKQLGFLSDRPFMLRGLGSHPALRAYRVQLHSVRLEGIEFTALEALVLPENEFILSRRLGTQIDGILGYDFFC